MYQELHGCHHPWLWLLPLIEFFLVQLMILCKVYFFFVCGRFCFIYSFLGRWFSIFFLCLFILKTGCVCNLFALVTPLSFNIRELDLLTNLPFCFSALLLSLSFGSHFCSLVLLSFFVCVSWLELLVLLVVFTFKICSWIFLLGFALKLSCIFLSFWELQIMGIISRKIFPACGNMCVCCPALRSRSRQPVKRYRKLLADIFPKSPVCIL